MQKTYRSIFVSDVHLGTKDCKAAQLNNFLKHNSCDTLYLIGLNIKCYDKDLRAKIGFTAFNLINHALKHFSPFAVGAFMLTRRDRFEEFGGFPEQFSTSEDYFLSRMYSPKKFRIIRHHFGQDSRRFKKMGYMGMAKYLVKNFVNRNNKAYWDKLDNSRYWS